jgi:hypothetical protein
MLFDLQSSRRRRTTVKIVYSFLAVLIAAGLVLLGVGVGNGNGGFLNSLSNNGSGGNAAQNSAVSAAVKKAEKQVKANPKSASAWKAMIIARYQAAGIGSNYNSSTETYTAGGKAQLKQATAAYTKYTSLVTGKPDSQATLVAAQAYTLTGDYAGATNAWQGFVTASPTEIKGYECLAFNAYAAKNKTIGNEASAKAVAMTPKLNRLTTKQLFTQAKASNTVAKSAAVQDC